ncbi:MAG: beta-N-acetylhexosaminidase [Tissierellaceae bacterium]
MEYRLGILLLLILSLLATMGCKDGRRLIEDIDPQESIEHIPEEEEGKLNTDHIQEKIKGMNLKEKIGQLIISGFDGRAMNEEIIEYIRDYNIGGLILFSRNIEDPEQTIDLLSQIKAENKNNIPLFLSIDEEGGSVSRLPKPFKRLASASRIGTVNNPQVSYDFGKLIGQRVRALGFNMVFGPVLDINSNPKNPVIGDRAFGASPSLVSEVGIPVMEGVRDSDIISVVKHFPGHGDTEIDSHVDLPKSEKSLEELGAFELLPFENAILKEVDGIMAAHILYPQIDHQYPATMSATILDELLRGRLGYGGLIFSDDMTMGAIVKNYGVEEGVLRFLQSGGDVALLCHEKENTLKSINRILQAVENGDLAESEIDKKLHRILEVKEKYGLNNDPIKREGLEEIFSLTDSFIDELNSKVR